MFVSSTLDELAAERATTKEAIAQLRLTPVLFESGARPYPPRALYRAYLAQCDVFLGIYWQRYGQVGPGMDVSGLEDEYRLSAEKPRLIYIKKPAPQQEPRLLALLDRIRAEDVASYQHFVTPDELRDLVANDLALLLTEHFAATIETPAPESPAPLPVQRCRLVDREQEISASRTLLLSDEVGLVTLTGPGGVGKTRTAMEVAADVAEQFAHGVAFIPLDTVTDPERLPAVIAKALRIPESGRARDEDLLAYLRPRQVLLLLDNVEQLIAAAAPLATQALGAAPRLKILATGREPLRVRHEHIVSIPPLALPDSGSPPALAALAQIPSVALFVERAREVRPDFALSDENALAVAEICRRLDGLPLALELASARLATLTPQAVLARLRRRLPLLARGPRDLPARQQNLRDTIDWSYDLLTEGEKTLFRRLGVFLGGFTLEAVETVCLTSDPALPSPADLDALDGVSSLVDKSLVYPVQDRAEEPRFAMLDTICEYATEQLAATGEVEDMRRLHAAYFVRVAEEAAVQYARPGLGRWLQRLHSEEDNLRAALFWSTAGDWQPSGGNAPSVETGTVLDASRERSHLGLRLAGALASYWVYRGQLQEERAWLETLLARCASNGPSVARGRGQFGAGLLAWAQGDLTAAGRWAEAALATAQATGEVTELTFAQVLLGMVHMGQGDTDVARPLLETARAALHEAGDFGNEANVLYFLARAFLMGGDAAAAQRYAEDSLPLYQLSENTPGRAMALSALGAAALAQGDTATAITRFAEAMPLMRAAVGPYFLAEFLAEAGMAWIAHGDLEQAQQLLTESLRSSRDMGRPTGTALMGLSEVAAARGQSRRAARLLGASEAVPAAGGPQLPPYLHALVDRAVAAARDALGAEAFEAARAEGAALSQEQAITEALEDTPRSG